MERIVMGKVMSAEEIEKILSANEGVVTIKLGADKYRVFSQQPWRIDRPFELDHLKKNRTGAIVLYGLSRVVCFPNF